MHRPALLERMDAMISETDDDERPVAYNRVAGVVVTGNEDGAHRGGDSRYPLARQLAGC